MNDGLFIAGDWGTTSFRLHLCSADTVLESRSAPGIAKLAGTPADALFEAIAPWTAAHGALPVYLTGMVGSNIGWVATPYVACPVGRHDVRAGLTLIRHNGHAVHIAGGVSCENPLGAPDFMRGEETQIFGAMTLDENLVHGTHFLCLPGTHSKWVLLKDGRIERFHTALTGELYELLLKHSVLVQKREAPNGADQPAFAGGVAAGAGLDAAPLLHALFGVRAHQIAGDLAADQAAAYLSGLMIGADVAGACRLFGLRPEDGPITLIGATALTTAYRKAIELKGGTATELDGSAAALAGLRSLFRED